MYKLLIFKGGEIAINKIIQKLKCLEEMKGNVTEMSKKDAERNFKFRQVTNSNCTA